MGWIKIDRAISDSLLWNDGEPMSRGQAWIDLLLRANYTDGKMLVGGKVETIKRGQLHTSILHLAEYWRWSRNRVTRFLDLLESENMITTKRATNGTTITIVKWELYQGEGATDETPNGAPNETTNGAPNGAQYKKEKKERKIKKAEPFFPDNEVLDKSFKEYIDYRKAARIPTTPRAVELEMAKIKKLSGGNTEKAVAIINQTISRGWRGLFELSEEKKQKPKQTGFNNFEQREHDASYFEEMERRAIMGG